MTAIAPSAPPKMMTTMVTIELTSSEVNDARRAFFKDLVIETIDHLGHPATIQTDRDGPVVTVVHEPSGQVKVDFVLEGDLAKGRFTIGAALDDTFTRALEGALPDIVVQEVRIK